MFPKWKYHPTKPAVIVNTPEEERELGDSWVDSPADFAKATVKATEERIEGVAKHVHEAVVKELETLKVDYAEFFQKVKDCKAFKDIKDLIEQYETE